MNPFRTLKIAALRAIDPEGDRMPAARHSGGGSSSSRPSSARKSRRRRARASASRRPAPVRIEAGRRSSLAKK